MINTKTQTSRERQKKRKLGQENPSPQTAAMDGVDQEGVDLLETLTSKTVESMGERSLFDDMENESAEAASELTTTAPMIQPSTMAPVLEMVSPKKAILLVER